jgi:hypothetical protein
MYDDRIERLRREHDFDSWAKRGTPGIAPDLRLTADVLPGWRPQREYRYDKIRPPVTKSVWSRGESKDESLGIELYRCSSLDEAHALLLAALGEFQSAAVKQQPDTGIGDVAFGNGEPWLLLFARANYVVRVHNAGPRLVDALEVARAIDQRILSSLRPA